MWDQLWESRDDSPYDLTFDASGSLIVATGNKGKMYRLQGEPLRATLLARGSAQQVTAFYRDSRGRLYYATANPGKAAQAQANAAVRFIHELWPQWKIGRAQELDWHVGKFKYFFTRLIC